MVARRSLKAKVGVRNPAPEPKFWIFKEIHECPLCGRGKEYRERRPLPKPENYEDRVRWEQYFDWCQY